MYDEAVAYKVGPLGCGQISLEIGARVLLVIHGKMQLEIVTRVLVMQGK